MLSPLSFAISFVGTGTSSATRLPDRFGAWSSAAEFEICSPSTAYEPVTINIGYAIAMPNRSFSRRREIITKNQQDGNAGGAGSAPE
jgi:hypothetical protein